MKFGNVSCSESGALMYVLNSSPEAHQLVALGVGQLRPVPARRDFEVGIGQPEGAMSPSCEREEDPARRLQSTASERRALTWAGQQSLLIRNHFTLVMQPMCS